MLGVVKLQAQIWCPLEVWSNTSSDSNIEIPSTTTFDNIPRPNSLKKDSIKTSTTTATGVADSNASSLLLPPPTTPQPTTTVIINNLRDECQDLLKTIPDAKLEEVKRFLLQIQERK